MICKECLQPMNNSKHKEIYRDIIKEYYICQHCKTEYISMFRNATVDQLLIERENLLKDRVDINLIEKINEIDNKLLTEMAELELILSDR